MKENNRTDITMVHVMISYNHLQMILLIEVNLTILTQMVQLIYVDVLLFDDINVVEMFDQFVYHYDYEILIILSK
jgi:hypothetical protein